ncbi:Uncharacterised protein [Yersinia frederiksenii]|nr:Uncharacterised protein [Yersinia frederiksenii]
MSLLSLETYWVCLMIVGKTDGLNVRKDKMPNNPPTDSYQLVINISHKISMTIVGGFFTDD